VPAPKTPFETCSAPARVFPDDPLVRAHIGFQTEPDSAPADALIQACGGCHNDVLDQGISRARFNIDISRMDRAELDIAVARIGLPRTAAGAMPPPEARQLDEATRARLIEHLALEADVRGFEPRLQRAATVGMTGGALPYNSSSTQ
jgi:hypothetical protein